MHFCMQFDAVLVQIFHYLKIIPQIALSFFDNNPIPPKLNIFSNN